LGAAREGREVHYLHLLKDEDRAYIGGGIFLSSRWKGTINLEEKGFEEEELSTHRGDCEPLREAQRGLYLTPKEKNYTRKKKSGLLEWGILLSSSSQRKEKRSPLLREVRH